MNYVQSVGYPLIARFRYRSDWYPKTPNLYQSDMDSSLGSDRISDLCGALSLGFIFLNTSIDLELGTRCLGIGVFTANQCQYHDK